MKGGKTVWVSVVITFQMAGTPLDTLRVPPMNGLPPQFSRRQLYLSTSGKRESAAGICWLLTPARLVAAAPAAPGWAGDAIDVLPDPGAGFTALPALFEPPLHAARMPPALRMAA